MWNIFPYLACSIGHRYQFWVIWKIVVRLTSIFIYKCNFPWDFYLIFAAKLKAFPGRPLWWLTLLKKAGGVILQRFQFTAALLVTIPVKKGKLTPSFFLSCMSICMQKNQHYLFRTSTMLQIQKIGKKDWLRLTKTVKSI